MEFNNGFITALALFLEHKNFTSHIIQFEDKAIIDMRLYGASDHLFDMEIPETLEPKLRLRIFKLKDNCLKYRFTDFTSLELTNKLFKEAEDILARIDETIFKTKQIKMKHR